MSVSVTKNIVPCQHPGSTGFDPCTRNSAMFISWNERDMRGTRTLADQRHMCLTHGQRLVETLKGDRQVLVVNSVYLVTGVLEPFANGGTLAAVQTASGESLPVRQLYP